jgi:hypothetical protein
VFDWVIGGGASRHGQRERRGRGDRGCAEIDCAWCRADALINNADWMPGGQPILELEVSVLEPATAGEAVGTQSHAT